MSELRALLERLVRALEQADVPFMVVGSFASAAHGLPRATQDLDIVIDPRGLDELDALLAAFPPDAYYADPAMARDALNRRSMFNVIDHASGWKIDFIVRKNRDFSREEFSRRRRISLLGVDLYVASAEDTILAKLEWSRLSGGSERQRRDIQGVLRTTGDEVDRGYIERWVRLLKLDDEWALAQAAAVG